MKDQDLPEDTRDKEATDEGLPPEMCGNDRGQQVADEPIELRPILVMPHDERIFPEEPQAHLGIELIVLLVGLEHRPPHMSKEETPADLDSKGGAKGDNKKH